MKRIIYILYSVIIAISVSCSSDNNIIYVEFENVYGLEEKSPVRYEGLEVGIVKDIGISDNGNIITLIQFHEPINISVDAKICIRNESIFGDRYIEIIKGVSEDFTSSNDTVVGFLDISNPLDPMVNKATEILETVKQIADSIYF